MILILRMHTTTGHEIDARGSSVLCMGKREVLAPKGLFVQQKYGSRYSTASRKSFYCGCAAKVLPIRSSAHGQGGMRCRRAVGFETCLRIAAAVSYPAGQRAIHLTLLCIFNSSGHTSDLSLCINICQTSSPSAAVLCACNLSPIRPKYLHLPTVSRMHYI